MLNEDIRTHILCSKVFGKLTDELAEQVALLARRLCADDILDEHTSFYFDGRLVALKKRDNGIHSSWNRRGSEMDFREGCGESYKTRRAASKWITPDLLRYRVWNRSCYPCYSSNLGR